MIDNPQWDGTDAAHPAWWRGEEAGVRGACDLITKVLDGQDTGSCYEPLETVRQRVSALRKELVESYRRAWNLESRVSSMHCAKCHQPMRQVPETPADVFSLGGKLSDYMFRSVLWQCSCGWRCRELTLLDAQELKAMLEAPCPPQNEA